MKRREKTEKAVVVLTISLMAWFVIAVVLFGNLNQVSDVDGTAFEWEQNESLQNSAERSIYRSQRVSSFPESHDEHSVNEVENHIRYTLDHVSMYGDYFNY